MEENFPFDFTFTISIMNNCLQQNKKMKYEYITQPDWIYLTDNDWNILAEITFEQVDDKTYDIDHTFVDESMRWQWIADELVEKAVDYIKSHFIKGDTEFGCRALAKKFSIAHTTISKIIRNLNYYNCDHNSKVE